MSGIKRELKGVRTKTEVSRITKQARVSATPGTRPTCSGLSFTTRDLAGYRAEIGRGHSYGPGGRGRDVACHSLDLEPEHSRQRRRGNRLCFSRPCPPRPEVCCSLPLGRFCASIVKFRLLLLVGRAEGQAIARWGRVVIFLLTAFVLQTLEGLADGFLQLFRKRG